MAQSPEHRTAAQVNNMAQPQTMSRHVGSHGLVGCGQMGLRTNGVNTNGAAAKK